MVAASEQQAWPSCWPGCRGEGSPHAAPCRRCIKHACLLACPPAAPTVGSNLPEANGQILDASLINAGVLCMHDGVRIGRNCRTGQGGGGGGSGRGSGRNSGSGSGSGSISMRQQKQAWHQNGGVRGCHTTGSGGATQRSALRSSSGLHNAALLDAPPGIGISRSSSIHLSPMAATLHPQHAQQLAMYELLLASWPHVAARRPQISMLRMLGDSSSTGNVASIINTGSFGSKNSAVRQRHPHVLTLQS